MRKRYGSTAYRFFFAVYADFVCVTACIIHRRPARRIAVNRYRRRRQSGSRVSNRIRPITVFFSCTYRFYFERLSVGKRYRAIGNFLFRIVELAYVRACAVYRRPTRHVAVKRYVGLVQSACVVRFGNRPTAVQIFYAVANCFYVNRIVMLQFHGRTRNARFRSVHADFIYVTVCALQRRPARYPVANGNFGRSKSNRRIRYRRRPTAIQARLAVPQRFYLNRLSVFKRYGRTVRLYFRAAVDFISVPFCAVHFFPAYRFTVSFHVRRIQRRCGIGNRRRPLTVQIRFIVAERFYVQRLPVRKLYGSTACRLFFAVRADFIYVAACIAYCVPARHVAVELHNGRSQSRSQIRGRKRPLAIERRRAVAHRLYENLLLVRQAHYVRIFGILHFSAFADFIIIAFRVFNRRPVRRRAAELHLGRRQRRRRIRY